jgi:hypothetical protein
MSKSSCVACIPPAGPQAAQVTPPLYGGVGEGHIHNSHCHVGGGGHSTHCIETQGTYYCTVMRDFRYRANGCCYLRVDPETLKSEKGICLT